MAKNPNDLNLNDRLINLLVYNSATNTTNDQFHFTSDSPNASLSDKGIGTALVNTGDNVKNTKFTFGNPKTQSGSAVEEEPQCYDLSKKPDQAYRGVVVVLSYGKFHDSRLNRPGNDLDVKIINTTFDRQDFEVIVKKDKTKEKTWDIVKELSQNKDYAGYSCFIMIILSHGKENEFYCADGETMEYEKIFNLFQENGCQFVDKPKLFFIQACQGVHHDRGVEKTMKSDGETMESDAKIKESAKPNPNILPSYADILEFYCSYPGFRSYRKPNSGPESGTWFIRTLCEMITQNATKELQNIVQLVMLKAIGLYSAANTTNSTVSSFSLDDTNLTRTGHSTNLTGHGHYKKTARITEKTLVLE